MTDKWYNGFSPKERDAAEALVTRAFLRGEYHPGPECALCGLEGVIKGKVSPLLTFHHEDYGRPLEPVIACVECHMRLHARFHMPNRWRRHCEIIRRMKARAWPSTSAFFAMTNKAERHDIGEVKQLEPLPGRWWERLSYDRRLKLPVDPFERIELVYGETNDVTTLTVRVVALATSPVTL